MTTWRIPSPVAKHRNWILQKETRVDEYLSIFNRILQPFQPAFVMYWPMVITGKTKLINGVCKLNLHLISKLRRDRQLALAL
ncbi:MAG: hypothetical protein IPL59_23820 [Candidatus Competibacteraceae bacterium]|nr:hypothetical protein [Candidatus Competibacteraceae bacterium]